MSAKQFILRIDIIYTLIASILGYPDGRVNPSQLTKFLDVGVHLLITDTDNQILGNRHSILLSRIQPKLIFRLSIISYQLIILRTKSRTIFEISK